VWKEQRTAKEALEQRTAVLLAVTLNVGDEGRKLKGWNVKMRSGDRRIKEEM
jgi:hypothetical protein